MVTLPLVWTWEWLKKILSCRISVEVRDKKRGKKRNG